MVNTWEKSQFRTLVHFHSLASIIIQPKRSKIALPWPLPPPRTPALHRSIGTRGTRALNKHMAAMNLHRFCFHCNGKYFTKESILLFGAYAFFGKYYSTTKTKQNRSSWPLLPPRTPALHRSISTRGTRALNKPLAAMNLHRSASIVMVNSWQKSQFCISGAFAFFGKYYNTTKTKQNRSSLATVSYTHVGASSEHWYQRYQSIE